MGHFNFEKYGGKLNNILVIICFHQILSPKLDNFDLFLLRLVEGSTAFRGRTLKHLSLHPHIGIMELKISLKQRITIIGCSGRSHLMHFRFKVFVKTG